MACWRDIVGSATPTLFDSWLRRILVRSCYREAAGRGRRRMALKSAHLAVT